MLAQYGFADVPVVRGSALRAFGAAERGEQGDPFLLGIAELVRALDEHIPVPERDLTSPFLMPIETRATDAH